MEILKRPETLITVFSIIYEINIVFQKKRYLPCEEIHQVRSDSHPKYWNLIVDCSLKYSFRML